MEAANLVSTNRMRIQQAILGALADAGNAASVERLGKMLRRYPPDLLQEALRHLTEGGLVEVGEHRGTVRARLTEHFRLRRTGPRRSEGPPEPLGPPVVLPPLPYADSDVVHHALVVCVEEARRFIRGEVYLGPFMKRRMNPEFPRMTNEERKGLIDHLRALGCVRVEKRLGMDGSEYSVLLVESGSTAVRQVWRLLARSRPSGEAGPHRDTASFNTDRN